MKQIVLKVEHRRIWYVLPPYAIAVLLCNTRFQQERTVLYDLWSSAVTGFFFFNFKNYGLDGISSPSLLNQMIRKGLKLCKQSFPIGLSEYVLHME